MVRVADGRCRPAPHRGHGAVRGVRVRPGQPRPARLENRRADGERRLDTTIAALKITSTHLSGAQLGITLTTLLTGFTFEPAVSALLAGRSGAAALPEGLVPVVGTVAGVALATLFSMVVDELVPKSFALALPVATAKLVLPFQAVFTMVFRPLIALFNNTANAIVRGFGIEPKEELSGARSAEELARWSAAPRWRAAWTPTTPP